MKKLIVILTAVALFFSSCENQFEVQNTSNLTGSQAAAIIEEDPSFLSSYIAGFYSFLVEYGGYHDYFGHLSVGYGLDMMGLDIALGGTWNWGTYDVNHDFGAYNYRRPRQMWNIYYTLIKQANDVIDLISNENPEDPTVRGYLGQAYALRAFSYTYLMQIFQDITTGTTPNAVLRTDAYAVPIIYAVLDGKTLEETEAVSGRNTIQIVMDEIQRNIDKALPLLEGYQRPSKNEVNYEVAQGIAARYYLTTQQWDKAIKAAQAAQKGFDLMDRTRLLSGMMEIEDNEVLWGFNHTTETQTTYASFFSHLSQEIKGYGGLGQSVHCIDYSLYQQISATDYRKAQFNTADGDPNAPELGGTLPYASRKFGAVSDWTMDYIYMRNAEMILIEAEAHARLNDGQATATLAKLMASRDPYWADNDVTVDDVLLQRRIELWGEGFEYFDLRRNGLGVNRRYENSNHLPGAQYEFKAHQSSWNFQIPQAEMQNNRFITEDQQNEWISGVPA